MNIRLLILYLVTALLVSSCDRAMPSGFWSQFEPTNQVKEISDQGPWGGHRAIHWETVREGSYHSDRIINFAKEGDWELIDSASFNVEQLKGWMYNKKPIFPLSHEGFEPFFMQSVSTYESFPRWINNDLKVYKFKTGMLAIVPGTDDSMEENGFIVIDREGKQMSVYHLWGE